MHTKGTLFTLLKLLFSTHVGQPGILLTGEQYGVQPTPGPHIDKQLQSQSAASLHFGTPVSDVQ
jgi:hypothetical protein